MKFLYQLDKCPLRLGLAAFVQQLPEDHSVYRVVSFLQVNEQVELTFLRTMHFIKQPTGMDGSGLALLEASLVNLRLDQVRVLSLDPFKDRFLHDL